MFKETKSKKIFISAFILIAFFSTQFFFEKKSAHKTEAKICHAEIQISQTSNLNTSTTMSQATRTATSTSYKKKYSNTQKDIIRAWVWRIVKRYQTAMDRLAKISNRLDSRAKKLEKEGLNISEVSIKTKQARTKISSAGDNVILAAASIKDIFEKNISPIKGYKKFREYTSKAKGDIKNAKKTLNKGVKLILDFKNQQK